MLSVADEITVIRRGTTVRTVEPAGRHRPPARRADGRLRAALAQHRGVDGHRRGAARGARPRRCPSAEGRPLLDDISFDIHRGEVLGIAGVEGNGQAELVEAIMGMRPGATGVDQRSAARTSPGTPRASAARPASATSPRTGTGTACCSTPRCGRTAILGHQSRPPSVKHGLIDRARRPQRHRADHRASTTSARPGTDTLARALSGGNQQKLIVGREMSGDPILLIAAHPTRGVDVGAQAAIWDHIKDARREGLAVLLISADLDELIGLSDRIEVILRGRLVGTFDPRRRDPRASSAPR